MGIAFTEMEKPTQLRRMPSMDEEEGDQAASKGNVQPKVQKTVCIITEFLEQGSLADILYGDNRLPPEVWTYELILTCALQAARGNNNNI